MIRRIPMNENEMKVKALFVEKRAFCMQKTAPIARVGISSFIKKGIELCNGGRNKKYLSDEHF